MRAALTSALIVVAACGGGGGNPDAPAHIDAHPVPDGSTAPDAVVIPDAPPPPPDAMVFPDAPEPDAPTAVCLAAPDYGAAAFIGVPGAFHDASDNYQVGGALNADADVFYLLLFPGFGPFTGGVPEPGTYSITGDDTNFSTCGVCGVMFTNSLPPDPDLSDPDRIYFAASGSVTITALGPNVTGHVDNLVLDHVTIDVAGGTFVSTPVGDCQTAITSLAFDVPITEMLTGGPLRLPLRRAHH